MRSNRRDKTAITLLLIAAALWPLAGGAQTDERPATRPHTLREDFQRDSLGQFASYPPAQDVGYEPTLAPTTDFDAPGGRALMRVVKPNVAGALRFGFIRQTSLLASEGAKLSFAYRLNHAEPDESLEIGVAGADGCRYVKRIRAGAGKWITTEIPLSEFRYANRQPPKSGESPCVFAVDFHALREVDADPVCRRFEQAAASQRTAAEEMGASSSRHDHCTMEKAAPRLRRE